MRLHNSIVFERHLSLNFFLVFTMRIKNQQMLLTVKYINIQRDAN